MIPFSIKSTQTSVIKSKVSFLDDIIFKVPKSATLGKSSKYNLYKESLILQSSSDEILSVPSYSGILNIVISA